MSGQIQREAVAEREAKYKPRHAVVKKHFEEVLPDEVDNLKKLSKYPILVDHGEILHSEIDKMVQQIYNGFKAGKAPERIQDGESGTYYLHDQSGARVSVFKPRDEEVNAVNNPKGWVPEEEEHGITIKSAIGGIAVGGAAAREIAAYYLDHPIGLQRDGLAGGDVIGFAGVPPTMFVKCLDKAFSYKQEYEYKLENYKEGSLQKYMENKGSFAKWKTENAAMRISEKLNLSNEEALEIVREEKKLALEEQARFWKLLGEEGEEVVKLIPVEEVQKLSVLDIRMVNLDRHGGNILVNENEINGDIVLIPIDHGYCIPTRLGGCCEFVWRNWPQARACYSNEIKKYIDSLRVDKDLELLRKHRFVFNEAFARTLHVSTMLLMKGVNKGLTPSEIGNLMCNELNEKTFIKEIVDEAEKITIAPYSTTREAAILNNVSEIMDVWLHCPSKLAPQLERFRQFLAM